MKSAAYETNYVSNSFSSCQEVVQHTTFTGRYICKSDEKFNFLRLLSEYLLWSGFMKKHKAELRIYCESDNLFSCLKMQTKLLKSYFLEIE